LGEYPPPHVGGYILPVPQISEHLQFDHQPFANSE
jgi:hypothetical protein